MAAALAHEDVVVGTDTRKLRLPENPPQPWAVRAELEAPVYLPNLLGVPEADSDQNLVLETA